MSIMNLRFLTADENIQNICRMYWELNSEGKFVYTVTYIAKQFDISSRDLGSLVEANCQAISDIKCSSCGKHYIYSNRSDYQSYQRYSQPSWTCPECTEREINEAKAKELEVQRNQIEIIKRYFSSISSSPININEVSFENAVCLLSLIRGGAEEDLSFIAPLWTFKQPLAPDQDFGIELVRQLYQQNLIRIHPDSSPDAFEFEGNNIKWVYLNRLKWAVPVDNNTNTAIEFVGRVETVFQNMNWPNHWYDEQLSFSRKIALHECLQYLKVCLEEHSFTFTPGDKTILVFSSVLEDYSIGQVFNFIWRAAKDAAAFYVREKVPKQHAANTVVGSIQRQAEKARAEKWEIKPYRRDFRCPQSLISQVLFNAVLQIGEDSLNKPIR